MKIFLKLLLHLFGEASFGLTMELLDQLTIELYDHLTRELHVVKTIY